jgi:type II secretory pathway component HofQ
VKVPGCAVVMVLAMTGAAAAQPQREAAPQPRTITLELRDAEIGAALAMLFEESAFSYVLEPGVEARLTLDLREVSWDQALRVMLEALDLTYTGQDGVYRIGRRRTAEPQREVRPLERPRQLQEPGGTATRLEWLKVRYADPGFVAALFGGVVVGPTAYPGMTPYPRSYGPWASSGPYGAFVGLFGAPPAAGPVRTLREAAPGAVAGPAVRQTP